MGIFEAIEPNNIIYNDKQFKKDCNVFCTNFNDIMQCITTLSINDYIYKAKLFDLQAWCTLNPAFPPKMPDKGSYVP